MIINLKSGLAARVNINKLTSNIVKSSKVRNDLFIPQYITYNSQEYQIVEIEDNAFKDLMVNSIRFSKSSMLKKISKNAFNGSSLQQLQLPSNIENIEEGWCAGTNDLIDLTIPSNNKYFTYHENELLIKNDNKILLFARRDIETVTIPQKVKRIGSFSFSNCKRLQSVAFESNVIEEIGESSFYSCLNLREISLPSSLKKIEKKSFAYCSQLESLVINEDSELESISRGAFKGTSLRKLFLPKNLQCLEEGWCCGANKLNEIPISKKNKKFILIDKSFLIQLDSILLFVRRDIESVILPSNIKKIAKSAFEGCFQLNSIDFELSPEIEYIDDKAFNNCTNLQTILNFPSTIKRIGRSAFSNCHKIEFLNLNENSKIEKICKNAFKSTSINELCLPRSLNYLEEGWCSETKKLTDLTVSSENENFSYKNNVFLIDLKNNVLLFASRDVNEAVIPSDIKRIGDSSFSNCKKLKSVTFSEDSKIEEIGHSAFNYCSKLRSISSIPKSVKLIESHCFNLVLNLVSIEFLSENLKIDEICFEYCSKLSLASFPNASKVTVGWRGFYGVSRDFSLYVLHNGELICDY